MTLDRAETLPMAILMASLYPLGALLFVKHAAHMIRQDAWCGILSQLNSSQTILYLMPSGINQTHPKALRD